MISKKYASKNAGYYTAGHFGGAEGVGRRYDMHECR
jgi:hypothetical protein